MLPDISLNINLPQFGQEMQDGIIKKITNYFYFSSVFNSPFPNRGQV